VKVWDSQTYSSILSFNLPADQPKDICALDFSKDGRYIAVGTGKGMLYVYSAHDGSLVRNLNVARPEGTYDVNFNFTSDKVAACDYNGGCVSNLPHIFIPLRVPLSDSNVYIMDPIRLPCLTLRARILDTWRSEQLLYFYKHGQVG
jgi:WD40 repeat protein